MDLLRLWRNVKDGDDEAIAQLLETYRPYLLAIANASLHKDIRRKIAPSDVVQETLISAHNGFPKFTGTSEEALRGWLRRILKNQLFDYSRAFQFSDKRNVNLEVSIVEVDVASAIDQHDSPTKTFLQGEQASRLRIQIESLPEMERDVVKLYHERGLTFVQIADKLNCSRETARRTWGRALKLLAEAFGDDSCLHDKTN